MPQVGYSATSRDLSNKNFFKYFLRVVPADKLQAQVMIDLMLAHNWTYITVTYTEGKLDRSGAPDACGQSNGPFKGHSKKQVGARDRL